LKEFVRYVDRHRTHLFDDVIYLKTEKQGIPRLLVSPTTLTG
jgi:DNA gyrase subunit B